MSGVPLPTGSEVPEILDISADKVVPFDVVGEGQAVHTITYHYHGGITLRIGTLVFETDNDGVKYPMWSSMEDRIYHPYEIVRVIRGLGPYIIAAQGRADA